MLGESVSTSRTRGIIADMRLSRERLLAVTGVATPPFSSIQSIQPVQQQVECELELRLTVAPAQGRIVRRVDLRLCHRREVGHHARETEDQVS